MIQETYNLLCNTKSDINEHLPTLYKYACMCDHITEFGVRGAVSTWAFLAAKPKVLKSYDFCWYEGVQKAIDASHDSNTEFEFKKVNVLGTTIEQTDMLFIDTFHHPLQLKRELQRHCDKVNKYIILHDTQTHKRVNEKLWPDERNALSREEATKFDIYPDTGIHHVIIEFLYNHKQWFLLEVYSNNNGLTILEKDAPR